MVEQNEKVGALPTVHRLSWEGAGWLSRLWWVPILALAMALRFYHLTSAAIWGDEGSSLLLSEYALADLWFHAAHDVHPPLYFLLLRGWIEVFGDSIGSIRSLSAIPGVAVVGLGIWLTRQLSTRRAAVLAGILLALLPTAVRYSQEVRMYSLLGVWLLGATLALVYWVRQPERTRYLAVYVLLMSAGFYTHYFTALCVLVHWAYLGLQAPGQRLITRPAWWAANVAIVLLYLPWLPSLLDLVQHVEELKVGGDIGWEEPVNLLSLPSMVWQFLLQDDGLGLWPPLFWLFPLLLARGGCTGGLAQPRGAPAGTVLLAAAAVGLWRFLYLTGVYRALPHGVCVGPADCPGACDRPFAVPFVLAGRGAVRAVCGRRTAGVEEQF